MNIWLITIGEPWPTDPAHPRLLRTGINARFLTAQGHTVTFWNSTFDHTSKKERVGKNTFVDSGQGYKLSGLYGGSYQRNISLQRISYHRAVARSFADAAKHLPRPDIIVVSLTPLELAAEALRYGHSIGCPVVVDIRDFWPDIWSEQLPKLLKPARHMLLYPFYRLLWQLMRKADAVIGITDAAVQWGLDSVGRRAGRHDMAFPLIYDPELPATDRIIAAESYWQKLGVTKQPGVIIGCFFGTFTSRVDFETPLRAMMSLPPHLQGKVKLVLCGAGEMAGSIANLASANVVLPGWVDAAHIRALMQMSDFGLLPYIPTMDFVRSLPNKVFEYLSGGLPIVTSLEGEIDKLFSRYHCGRSYRSGDPASLQTVLEDFMASPEALQRLKSAALSAQKDFETDAICRRFESFLIDCVAVKRA